jgi:hypothetical protein
MRFNSAFKGLIQVKVLQFHILMHQNSVHTNK